MRVGPHPCLTHHSGSPLSLPVSNVRLSWSYIVIDEAHRIKNENSKLSKSVRTFKVCAICGRMVWSGGVWSCVDRGMPAGLSAGMALYAARLNV